MIDKKIWFITGCSTGFGRELAKMVLDRGYRAVVPLEIPPRSKTSPPVTEIVR